MKKNRRKSGGEVFTPWNIVGEMLSLIDYRSTNENILKRHVIDNSCGDGAFLVEIVKRYVAAWKFSHARTNLAEDLSKYIHGIEINEESHARCIENLNNAVKAMGLKEEVDWDIVRGNALTCGKYIGKMDYVVGNPPYVRVHNVKDDEGLYGTIKNYSFCKNGSTDTYLAFYELGIKMLSNRGSMVYISPSGWVKGPAGKAMRDYIKESKNLAEIIDIGHEQVFGNNTTYVMITRFDKKKHDYVLFSNHNEEKIALSYDKIFINDEMFLGDPDEMLILDSVESYDGPKRYRVKNGLVTLSDKLFISSEPKSGKADEMLEIPVIKASTGENGFCIFPYDREGVIISLQEINEKYPKLGNYISENIEKFENRDYDGEVYGLGRRQGISDVWKNKFAVNNIIKGKEDIKFSMVRAGTGVYSGYYITTNDESADFFKEAFNLRHFLFSDDFIKYVKALRKYKSGGYYTFTAKNLEKYLNWKAQETKPLRNPKNTATS